MLDFIELFLAEAFMLHGSMSGMSLLTRRCGFGLKSSFCQTLSTLRLSIRTRPNVSSPVHSKTRSSKLRKPTPAIIPNPNAYLHPINDFWLAYSAISSPSTSLIMMHVSFAWPLLRIFNIAHPQHRHMRTTHPPRSVNGCCWF